MTTIDITAIIMAMINLLSTCGWFVAGRKYKQEVESIKADNRMKDMELAKQYVEEFIKHIVKPLEARVDELANKVKDLTDAVEQIGNCPHSADCPVRDELRKQQGASHQ